MIDSPNFLIIVTGYRCSGYVRPCYNSIIRQPGNWQAVFIDDGSPTHDVSTELIHYVKDDRCTVVRGSKNRGAAYRRHQALQNFKGDDETVVVLVGMDDELMAGALGIIAEHYDQGRLMTYGNWINQNGIINRVTLAFDQDTHDARDYRKVKYRSTAPNTFKKHLYDRIPEEDLKVDGAWQYVCTEGEVMFSCLEMCGQDRIGVVEKPIYYYHEGLSNGTLRRFGRSFKYDIFGKICARPKRDLI